MEARGRPHDNRCESALARQTILLFDLSQMVGDLVEGVLADEEVEFMRAGGDFVETVARLRPDVAVVQTDRAQTSLSETLEHPPQLRVLLLAGDRGKAALYNVQPSEVDFLGPHALRRALHIGGGAE
jgi:hypothetical protein